MAANTIQLRRAVHTRSDFHHMLPPHVAILQ
jgi:hypothetical protein